MKKLFSVSAILFLVTFFFASCTKEQMKGDIYLKIISTPSLSYYNDDNPGIPFNFSEGVEYGPCPEGTYTYSFETEANSAGNYWYIDDATYTLETPVGKSKRVYTLSLGPTMNLTYVDY